jgi:hypothetical protein
MSNDAMLLSILSKVLGRSSQILKKWKGQIQNWRKKIPAASFNVIAHCQPCVPTGTVGLKRSKQVGWLASFPALQSEVCQAYLFMPNVLRKFHSLFLHVAVA